MKIFEVCDKLRFNGTGSMDETSKSQFTVGKCYYVTEVDHMTVSIKGDNRTWTMSEYEAKESFDNVAHVWTMTVYGGSMPNGESSGFVVNQYYECIDRNPDSVCLRYKTFQWWLPIEDYYEYFHKHVRTIKVF